MLVIFSRLMGCDLCVNLIQHDTNDKTALGFGTRPVTAIIFYSLQKIKSQRIALGFEG
jgi:hypothetical protein